MKVPLLPRGRAAFTLIEVLVVITIISLLFALVMGGFSYAERSSKRNVSRIRLDVIRSTLETYKNEFGEYPEPANPGATVDVTTKTYEVSSAAMLYQMLSGDGSDQILIRSGENQTPSNGELDDDERKNVKLSQMPKEMWTKNNDTYFVIDGFGRPFQYIKGVDIDPTATVAVPATTINPTYDIWSYGEDVENTTAKSIDTLTDQKLKQDALKWVRNW